MQATSDHHDDIRESGFRVAELVFSNPTDFDAGNRMLDTHPRAGEFAIMALLAQP
jgi:hypothetical protein